MSTPLPEPLRLDALAQSALLRRGELSVEELTRSYLARIEALDDTVSAFVQRLPERALRRARALDGERVRDPRAPRGPLWGLPTGLKDLHLARGTFTRLGSRAFRYLWSPFDDVTAASLREAGMVLLGKLATSELAILPFVDTELHPPTRNPWDLGAYSGGSSGGSSAALAAGMMPLAPASDGAGSIRIPAAFCGLVGHKPTRGLVPNPYAPLEKLDISVIGPHARSIPDAAALLDVLRAPAPRGHRSWLEGVRAGPTKPLRVRFTTDNPLALTEPAEAAAVHRAARALEALGHQVEERRAIEGTLEEFLPIFYYLVANMFVPRPSLTQPTTQWLRAQGQRVRFEDARAAREGFARRIEEVFRDTDLWLTPTVVRPPPRVGSYRDAGPEQRFREAAAYGAFTAVFNASGHPATSVPVWPEAGPSGPPPSVQLVARCGEDLTALRTAAALLEALGTPLQPLAPL